MTKKTETTSHTHTSSNLAQRFRGFLPVVIDVETAGVNPKTDALLEVAVVILRMENGNLVKGQQFFHHIEPFAGANLCKDALAFNKIDPYHPFREAIPEKEALADIFDKITAEVKAQQCTRAVLVGHNSWFDLHFLQAAQERAQISKTPLHKFTSFDTATLSALVYGHTVLAKACQLANLEFKQNEAHSAIYDADKTAELFCKIVNSHPIAASLID